MHNCELFSTISRAFSSLSLVSWITAQGPQIYFNYVNKSTDGIAGSFLVLWFFGDFLSFLSCILSTTVLKFQVYLSLFFLANDFALTAQFFYYKQAKYGYKPSQHIAHESAHHRENMIDRVPSYDRLISENQLEQNGLEGLSTSEESIITSNLNSPHAKYNSIVENKSLSRSLVVSAVFNATGSEALSVFSKVIENKDTGDKYSLVISQFFAWSCAFVYCSSRVPQLLKNYKRKSVEGISPLLFGSALMANLCYTLSILTSCKFVYNDSKAAFFIQELPYILGSAGTILFDFIYFYQRSIYRFRENIPISMHHWEE